MSMEPKGELLMPCSVIPSDSHTTQAFTQLEQGLDELLDEYLQCVSELSSKIYHTSDMSNISTEDINHYAVVHGLNFRKLKDSIVGHWSMQWK